MKIGSKALSLFFLLSSCSSTFTTSFRKKNINNNNSVALAFGRSLIPHNTRSTPSTLTLSPSLSATSLFTTFVGHRRAIPASTAFFQSQKQSSLSISSSLSLQWLSTTRGGSGAAAGSALQASSSSAVEEEKEPASLEEDQAQIMPVEIFRKDYKPLPFVVDKINLDFVIQNGKTIVTSELFVQKNNNVDDSTVDADADADAVLELDGDDSSLKLISIERVDNDQVKLEYSQQKDKLIIQNPSAGMILKLVVEIVPEDNTQLSGLYKSDDMYCTQCEAMGFRRITYYPDRPDNMAIFDRVRLEADKVDYPVLLANGNLLESGDCKEDQRHYAVWSDPFPKPSYLFCCVAGNLGSIKDTFTTQSGREVTLELFSEHANVHKLQYAMDSLKNAMKWDEDKYGLEYDLDLYNVVAVDSFNMGAMENKGLNVFNTAFVLADKSTATDADFERVEGVIGHEYFHNWTGNRVTCRDWFQLTLKEGLTVFRDQQFSGDMMNSPAVKRIEDVKGLRGRQFNEDAGPMSHPIRPDSYISMDNFYTATVYEKGAEIIRMYETLLSPEGFRKGMDLYFERHDGQAVTCDDFLSAMQDANNYDLQSQFALWYSTNGTPTVTYDYSYDNGVATITLTQSSNSETPLLIPVAVGLLDKETGAEVVPTTVLEFKETTQTFEFSNLNGKVVPSILRGFSAPVKLIPKSGQEDEELLAFLAANDTDGFNKWEAGQKLFTTVIFQAMKNNGEASTTTLDFVKEAFGRTLSNTESTDYSMIAYALMLPTESTLAELIASNVDPIAIHKSRGTIKQALARAFQSELQERYDTLTKEMEQDTEFKVDAPAIGKRRLRNVLLDYLCSIKETPQEQQVAADLAMSQFKSAAGMTDKLAALSALVSMHGDYATPLRDEAIQQFYNDANGDSLVTNKWFTVQALADVPDILDRIKTLKDHPDFTLKNPNRCRSLMGAFAMNAMAFHDESGAGYEFQTELLMELDKINPQISSRLAGSLIQWRKYSPERGALMKKQLEKLAAMKPISKDLFEIVSRGLKE